MVDILGGMSSGSPTSSFLAFKTADLQFYVGEEAVDIKYLQLDPATFQSDGVDIHPIQVMSLYGMINLLLLETNHLMIIKEHFQHGYIQTA